MRIGAWAWAVAATIGFSVSLSGDEVLFKSGDRLTGKVEKVAGGKMTFASNVAGTLTLNMADIKTFATDEPIELALADGSLQKQKVAASDEGYVTVAGTAQPASLPIANIAKINPDKPRWTGVVGVGATFVRGNTKSDTASVNVEAARRTENDRTSFGAGYYFAKQRDNATRDDSTIADNWFLKGQYDYFFSQKFYGYGNLRYEKDRIANLDARITPGLGVGYQWIERADLNFSTEAGANWVYEKYTDPSETRTYMAGRLAYHLDKTFNEHVKGFHNLEYIPSFERADTFLVNADVGLRAAVTARMAIEAKTQLAYNAQPSEGRDKKDLRHILGVAWTF
ncbi:MAG: DUF481 domain-containing protein [Kiritimatiellia bacterium]|jgi:putative salt-induced outer membrane protein YdiY|nr:DUF481 domain-containing protein [Kiritimatiellia bacterium]